MKLHLCTNLAYYWFMKEEGSTPCADPGIQTIRAAHYLQKHLVCEDKEWLYIGTDPSQLRKYKKCHSIDTPPDNVEDAKGWGVQDYLSLPAGKEAKADGSIDIKDTLTLERQLAEGHDIVFGTIVAWSTGDAKEIIDVRLGPAGQPIFGAGGHAMVIVGYDKSNEKKPYFIVKNSWGAKYGQKGYLYLSYDYIRTYAKYGYVTKSIKRGKIKGAVDKKEAKGKK